MTNNTVAVINVEPEYKRHRDRWKRVGTYFVDEDESLKSVSRESHTETKLSKWHKHKLKIKICALRTWFLVLSRK